MVAKFRCAWQRGSTWWSAKAIRIRHFWSDERSTGGDCFWWMDMLFLIAGVRSVSTSNWTHERKIRIFSNGLLALDGIVFFRQLCESLDERKDLSIIVMELTKVAGALISLLRMLATGLLVKPITTLRFFITSNTVTSGDVAFDERELAKFNSSTGYELFRFRLPASWIGKWASSVLNTFLVGATPVAIIPKIICCTACIGVILMGMRTKLRLLAHRFSKIVQQMDAMDDEQCFEQVAREVREALDQHLVYWNNLGIMKQLVGKLFLLVHYFSVFAIGGMIFACNEMQLSFMIIIFAVSVSFFLSEYYLLCHLADSLQDEATSISNDIFEICSQIPFRPERRSEYVQLRTSLMIVWITTTNGISVDCKGIFKIDRHTFITMLNVVYSFITFLVQMN